MGHAHQSASPTVAQYLELDFPELETVARVFLAELLVQHDGTDLTLGGQYVDPEFLEIFDLEMIAGERSLERPRSVLIAESAATAMFGAENPIGQPVTMQTLNALIDGTVVGIYRDLPDNSHFVSPGRRGMQVLTSIDSWRDLYIRNYSDDPLWWEQDAFTVTNWATYVVLPAEATLTGAELNRRLEDFARRRVPPSKASIGSAPNPCRALRPRSSIRILACRPVCRSLSLSIFLAP